MKRSGKPPREGDRARSDPDTDGSGGSRPGDRRLVLWGAAGAAVSLALALAAFDPYLFTGGDNAHYYALARALATGRGYVDLVAPGAPPHVQYPPGFPALLVPFYLLSGGHVVALKAVSWLALAGLLWGVWNLARNDRALPGWVAPAAVWTVGLYPVAQLYAHRLLSDLTYAAVVTLALATLNRTAVAREDGDGIDAAWWIGCALAVAAFYVRAAGITLLAAVVVWALLRRRWRHAASAAAVFAVGTGPWWAWTRLARPPANGGGTGYVEQFTDSELGRSGGAELFGVLGERLRDVAIEYGTYQFPGLFWPGDPPPDLARVAAVLLGGTLLILGVARLLRDRGPAPWDAHVVFALGLLPLWPWIGDRYMLALAPFLWLYLLAGLDTASRYVTRGSRPAIAAAGMATAILLATQIAALPGQWERTRAWLSGDRLEGYPAFWSEYFEAADWIGDHTPEDAVILARKPSLVWYWSERPAVVWPWSPPEERWRFIRETGITHVLVEPSTERALAPTLGPRQDLLTLVHRSPRGGAAVLELAPASPRAPIDR